MSYRNRPNSSFVIEPVAVNRTDALDSCNGGTSLSGRKVAPRTRSSSVKDIEPKTSLAAISARDSTNRSCDAV